jgi:RNA polymerase sigma-70 factor (ECF subfamily)
MMDGWLILLALVYAPASAAERDEEQLLAKAYHYDEAALGELYDRYEGKIYNYIYRRTGEQSVAEDLTGQVFLKMLEAIRNRRAWHSSFSGWLYRIAHNLVIDHYRQRNQQVQVSLEDEPLLPALDDNPVQATELKLDIEQLRSAIARLTDEQAEVIGLRFLEGYSISEVAVMMNKSEGSIKALQYRAVANLRQLLLADS